MSHPNVLHDEENELPEDIDLHDDMAIKESEIDMWNKQNGHE